MDPITMLLIAGGVSLAGNLIGQAMAAGDRQKADALRAQALALWGQQKGPELDAAVAASASRKTNLGNENHALRGQQLAMSNQLTQRGGSLDQQAQSQQTLAELDAERQNRGMQGAIQNSMASKGTLGSGTQALMQQMGVEDATANAFRSNTAAAQAQNAQYLQRLGMANDITGQVRGMDRQNLSSQDAIDQFNSQMKYNAAMDTFNGNLAVTQGKANAMTGAANNYTQQGNTTANQWGGAGNDLAGMTTATGMYMAGQKPNPGGASSGNSSGYDATAGATGATPTAGGAAGANPFGNSSAAALSGTPTASAQPSSSGYVPDISGAYDPSNYGNQQYGRKKWGY